jgi:hypothetical protein
MIVRYSSQYVKYTRQCLIRLGGRSGAATIIRMVIAPALPIVGRPVFDAALDEGSLPEYVAPFVLAARQLKDGDTVNVHLFTYQATANSNFEHASPPWCAANRSNGAVRAHRNRCG